MPATPTVPGMRKMLCACSLTFPSPQARIDLGLVGLEDSVEEVAHRSSWGSALGDAHIQPWGLCPYGSFVRPVAGHGVRAESKCCQRFLVFWYGLMVVLLVNLGKEGESGPR